MCRCIFSFVTFLFKLFLIILAINAISCHYDSSVKEYVHEFVINWLVLPWSAFSSPRHFRFHHSYPDHLSYQYQNHDPHSSQCEDDFEQQQDVFDDFLAENLYNEIIDSYIRDYFTNDETAIISQTTRKLLSTPEKLLDDNSKVPSPVDTTSRSPYTSPVEEGADNTSSVTLSPLKSPSSIPSSSRTSSPSPISTPAVSPTPSPVDLTDTFYARWEPLALEEIEEFQELEENFDGLFPDNYGDIKRNSWCADSENHKNACNGSTGDCFTAGIEHCQKAGDSCFGVMVHPGGWTKNHKAFKICTSMSMVPKSDWWTKLKIQQPLDTQHAVESDGLELITGLSDEECVNKLCCNGWQHPWHHLCYTGPHCSEDCSDCNGDPSICHSNKQNAGWQRFVPKDKTDTSSQASFPSSSPTSSPSSSPTTSPSSEPFTSPTSSPSSPPATSPSSSPTSSPSSSPTSKKEFPSNVPSTTVGVPSSSPTFSPSSSPTSESRRPVRLPTTSPSTSRTSSPSSSPTSSPNIPPTTHPSSGKGKPTTTPLINFIEREDLVFDDEWCKLEIMGRTGCEACANPNGAGKYCKESCSKISCSGSKDQNWAEWCVEDCGSDVQLDGVDCPFGCMISFWICFCMIVHIYRTCTRVDEDVVEAHLEEPSIPSPQEAQEVLKDLDTPRKIEEKQTDDWEVIQQREMSDQDGYVMVN